MSVGILGLAYPKMRRAGAELIVVLSHLGLGSDKTLAKEVAGIDVIVGGHSHNRMQQAEKIGTTLIVQAGAHGSDLDRLELTVEQGKVTAHVCTLTLLNHDKVEADDAAERLLEPHRKAIHEVIGQAASWLVRAQTLGGLRFRYDPKQPKGVRVWHVERTVGRWNPMDEYTVATNTMMAGGGHNYQTLMRGEQVAEPGSQYELIRRWTANCWNLAFANF